MVGQFAMMGMTGPYNALMADIGKANEIDATPYLVPQFTPPDQQQQEQGDPAAEQRIAMDQEKHDQDMDQSAEKHDLTMKQGEDKIKLARAKAAADRARPKAKAG